MNGLKTFSYLNIIHLYSYDVLIGMDWLDTHHDIVCCHNKTCKCLDEEGNKRKTKGILIPISLRQVTIL